MPFLIFLVSSHYFICAVLSFMMAQSQGFNKAHRLIFFTTVSTSKSSIIVVNTFQVRAIRKYNGAMK